MELSIISQVILLIFMHSMYSIIVVTREIFRIVKNRDIALISYVNLMFGFVYGIVPMLIHIGFINGTYINQFISYNTNGMKYFFIFYIFSVLSYIALQIGYQIKFRNKTKVKIIDNRIIALSAHALLVVSILSLYFWTLAYDSIFDIIRYADFIRAGYTPVNNSFAFLKYFVSLFMFSSYLYFILIYSKKVAKTPVFYIILFLLSFAGSIFYILANDGRMLAVIYLAVFVLIKFKIDISNKVKRYDEILRNYFLIGIISLIGVSLIEPVLYYAKYQVWRFDQTINPIVIIRDEFNFLLISLQTSLRVREYGIVQPRFFEDLLSGILAWVPSRFTTNMFTTTFEINTRLITGVSGQVPTDIVSMSLYSLGYIGPIVYPFLFGMLIKLIESSFYNTRKSSYYNMLYILIGFYMLKFVSHSDFNNILLNIFFFIIGHLVVKILSRVRL
ncbi:oligosaccharide repeat unit polymerase [Acholeplasma manati]|uniref:Oligosaccharide repeat unit polymerase n=1 Tax=Paracholeplasma manati TaxID=591373 RepID=A0ABT2Y4U7_9MOLU|nr:O-antigen polymerase [Paracholeplasma manati]MCV2231497.1 oligosaccharide repeat unit polymerase [Paracholeplasma manati]